MKRITLLIFYILFFVYASLLLLPKTNIYYAFEKELLKKEFIFSNEKIEEHLLSMDIKNFDVYYKKEYFLNVKSVIVEHNLLLPFLFEIDAIGDFGSLKAKPDLIKRECRVYLKASNFMKTKHPSMLKRMKLIKGIYIYDFKF